MQSNSYISRPGCQSQLRSSVTGALKLTGSVADDESRLDYTLVATDPVVFSAPVTLERSWLWQPGLEMYEFDCVAEWNDTD